MKKPILCYVTDRKSLLASVSDCSAATLLGCIEHAARAGVDWIQLREKDLEGRPLADLAARILGAIAASKSSSARRLLINDRLDVALAVSAGGVHLGENSLPVSEVVRWRAQARRLEFLAGVSCHSLESAMRATEAGADYIFYGPVFATPSKRAFGPPLGLPMLESVCRAVPVPVLAIGGITPENSADCLQAGAAGIAAIRMFQASPQSVSAAIARISQS